MKSLAVVLVVLAMGAVSAACATTLAQAPATRLPALEVPPVPPRVIEPPPPLPTPQPEPVGEPPAAQPPTTAKPRPQPRDNTQKPESKPPDTPAVEQPPVAAANTPPTAAVAPLRTSRTADGVQAERQIRDIIGRANGLLGKVNFQKLSAERQKAYNQAKQFIEGAEAAIRDAKFEYALELAEKAETFAKELQG